MATLKGRSVFGRIVRHGKQLRHGGIRLRWLRNDLDISRIAGAASSKCGKAVKRNRIRRWIKELMRCWEAELEAGYDIWVLINWQHESEDFAAFGAQLRQSLQRAGMLAGEPDA